MGHPTIVIGNIPAVLECRVLHRHVMGRHIQERGLLSLTYKSIVAQFFFFFFLSKDKEQATEADMSIKAVYKTIWTICQLKRSSNMNYSRNVLTHFFLDVQLLVIVHLFAKIGFAANEAATGLKIVEKGLRREDLALAVLIDFPFQIWGGWLAAKWSRGDRPLRPWIYAFWPRIILVVIAVGIVHWFPTPPISNTFFIFIIVHTVLSSFAS